RNDEGTSRPRVQGRHPGRRGRPRVRPGSRRPDRTGHGMSGGIRPVPEDRLAQLVAEVDRLRRDVRELQKPTGTQFRPIPVAAEGGFASGAAITGDTGVVWQSNTDFAEVNVEVPATASGQVLVYLTATVETNIFAGP